jgi:hypothetical protein
LPVDPGIRDQPLSLATDLGKAFLYARYDAELRPNGLPELGVEGIAAKRMRKMDDVENLDELTRISRALGARVDLAHLGAFAKQHSEGL